MRSIPGFLTLVSMVLVSMTSRPADATQVRCGCVVYCGYRWCQWTAPSDRDDYRVFLIQTPRTCGSLDGVRVPDRFPVYSATQPIEREERSPGDNIRLGRCSTLPNSWFRDQIGSDETLTASTGGAPHAAQGTASAGADAHAPSGQ